MQNGGKESASNLYLLVLIALIYFLQAIVQRVIGKNNIYIPAVHIMQLDDCLQPFCIIVFY